MTDTSVIADMKVPEVRRSLALIRSKWSAHSPHNPLRLTDAICPGVTVAEFAFRFVLSHHEKRHKKKNE